MSEPQAGLDMPDIRPTANRTMRGAMWLLLSQGTSAFTTFVMFVLMSRQVEHAELGEYMLAIVAVGAVQWLAMNAYREPIIQSSTVGPRVRDSVFWFSAGVAVAIACILIVTVQYLHWRGQWMIMASCLSVLAIKVFFDTLVSVPIALCYRELKFQMLAKISMVVSVFGLILGVVLLRAGWGVLAVAMMQSAMSFVSFVVILTRCAWFPSLHFARQDLDLLRRYSPHVVLWQGIDALNVYLDRFMVGAAISPQALGLYAFGRRLNDVLIEVLVGAAGNVALPTYSAIQNNATGLKRAYLRSMRLVSFGVFPIIGILFGVAGELVTMVFGEKWSAAVPIFQTFLLLGVIQTIGVIQASLIRSLGQVAMWARYQAVQAIANGVVLFFAIDYGIYVLAGAIVVRVYLFWFVSVSMVCRLIDLSMWTYLRMFIKPALAAILAGVVAAGVLRIAQGMPPVAILLGAGLLAGLTYAAAAFLVMKPIANDAMALIAGRG